ncbi:hypothetical protein C8R45DRAFT_962052 [Mycena sanguinolenta]|nr:hypothetical protein C8R45DRAFT_962052 [Mycena sanguinolenta]
MSNTLQTWSRPSITSVQHRCSNIMCSSSHSLPSTCKCSSANIFGCVHSVSPCMPAYPFRRYPRTPSSSLPSFCSLSSPSALVAVVGSQPTVENIVRSPWIPVHLGTVFAGDFLLCASMSFFLLTRSKQALPQTAGLLNAILKLTFQVCLPTALPSASAKSSNTVRRTRRYLRHGPRST